MCGRYSLAITPIRLTETFELPPDTCFPPARYNIAPTQTAPVVRLDENGARTLGVLRWGLVPAWAKDPSIGSRMVNARSETVAEKPSFRTAYKKRRCLVPASGFYEWMKAPGGKKQPYFIRPAADHCMAMAGLWERWSASDKEEPIETFTILTMAANQAMEKLHDRMPVLVPREAFNRWLDPAQDSTDLFCPREEPALSIYAVSTRVNSPTKDEQNLIEPIDTDAGPLNSSQQRSFFE